ncbi:MAG: hypothetical protein EB059_00775 [Alphaproteobacteria bacterium]|nr:hypothetical protein [Alphaproteobacteria bacterium]
MTETVQENAAAIPVTAEPEQMADNLAELAQFQQTKQDVEAAKLELAKIRQQIGSIAEECEEQKQKIDELNNKREDLEGIVAHLEIIKSSAEENTRSIASAQEEASEYKEYIEAVATQAKSVHGNLDEVTQKITAAESKAQENISNLQQQLDAITQDKEKLSLEIDALKQERDALKAPIEEIKQFRAEVESSKNAIANDVTAISQTKQQFEELKTNFQSQHAELASRQGEVVGKIGEISGIYDRMVQQQSILFDDKDEEGVLKKAVVHQINDANTASMNMLAEIKKDKEFSRQSLSEFAKKVSADIETLKTSHTTDLNSLIQNSAEEIKELKTELEKKILDLLPNAGAAGLSSAYVDAKSKYAPIKFVYTGNDKEFASFDYWLRFGMYVMRTALVPMVFYAMFLTPLLFVGYEFYGLFQSLRDKPEAFHPDVWMFRVLLPMPAFAISLFGFASIRLYRRLYEEYNHKQRVMELYYSFKKEVDGLADTELQKSLLLMMIKAVDGKPSFVMNRYDQGIELVPKLSFSGLISSIFGKKE